MSDATDNSTQPKRVITRIPDDYRGARVCGYFTPQPFKPCTAEGKYLLTVQIAETAAKRAHQMRYVFCEDHYPHKKLKTRQPPPDDSVTTQEAADIIGVSPWMLNHWHRQERGPKSVKINGRVWYNRQEVERWAEAYQLLRSGTSPVET